MLLCVSWLESETGGIHGVEGNKEQGSLLPAPSPAISDWALMDPGPESSPHLVWSCQ